MAKGKTVCVYGAKGGIGKSSFVMNLAGVFSNLKKKCLIIDLDLSNGAIACSLNADVNKTIYNFCDDYINNRFEDVDNYISVYNDYISFIASPKDPRQANKIDPKYIGIIIEKCLYKFDCVLIDTSYALNEISVFALDNADKILFMSSNDLISIKNLKSVLTIMQDNEFDNYKVIVNNSVNPNKTYFSLFDIKNMLGANVDYLISSDFYNKKIDSLILDGKIMTLVSHSYKDYKVFDLIAKDILGGNHE